MDTPTSNHRSASDRKRKFSADSDSEMPAPKVGHKGATDEAKATPQPPAPAPAPGHPWNDRVVGERVITERLPSIPDLPASVLDETLQNDANMEEEEQELQKYLDEDQDWVNIRAIFRLEQIGADDINFDILGSAIDEVAHVKSESSFQSGTDVISGADVDSDLSLTPSTEVPSIIGSDVDIASLFDSANTIDQVDESANGAAANAATDAAANAADNPAAGVVADANEFAACSSSEYEDLVIDLDYKSSEDETLSTDSLSTLSTDSCSAKESIERDSCQDVSFGYKWINAPPRPRLWVPYQHEPINDDEDLVDDGVAVDQAEDVPSPARFVSVAPGESAETAEDEAGRQVIPASGVAQDKNKNYDADEGDDADSDEEDDADSDEEDEADSDEEDEADSDEEDEADSDDETNLDDSNVEPLTTENLELFQAQRVNRVGGFWYFRIKEWIKSIPETSLVKRRLATGEMLEENLLQPLEDDQWDIETVEGIEDFNEKDE